MNTLRKKLIGDKAFYVMALSVALPMMLQDGITNFVGLLNNVMVGRTGTEQMSGVAIANQLLMIYNLCIFGGLSGAGIYAAQFYGSGNYDGVRNAFRLKLYIGAAATVLSAALFLTYGPRMICLFLQGNSDVGEMDTTAAYGMAYLKIMLLGTIPFFLTQTYSSTLKETGQTFLPMKASMTAVLTNLVLNYILIYGKLGAPALGVKGSAIATVISRFIELGIIAGTVHIRQHKYVFIQGIYKTMKVPRKLTGMILKNGLPLLVNEFLWSSGMAILNQSYSLRGLSVIAAINISSTITNLFGVVMMSMGNSVAILVGHQLGSGNMEKAKETDTKLIAFSICVSAGVGLILAAAAPYIPMIYETEDIVRNLATRFMFISAGIMPLTAFAITAYFTLRSGGKTIITFLYDSGFTWLVSIPTAFILAHYTNMNIVPLYLIVQLSYIIKCIAGYTMIKKGWWVQNII